MEATTVLTIFDKILNIIGLVKEGKLQQNDKIDSALKLTHKALVQTQLYLHRNGKRDTDKEFQLAELWYQASIPLRHVDKDLANICNLKGGFWTNPDAWENLEVGEYNIAISNVEEKVRELLNN
jgi:hypothetical protein